MSTMLPLADSATLPPKKPGPVSSLAVSFGPCCVHTPDERVNTHAAPFPHTPQEDPTRTWSLGPAISAVLPSADNATLCPKLGSPRVLGSLGVSLGPCCVQAPDDRVN